MAAYAYNAEGTGYVAVPTLAGNNTFSGIQIFNGNTQSTSTSTGTIVVTGGMGIQGNLYAGAVYGAVWNDLADCIEVPESTILEPGYCYCFDGDSYHKSNKYLEDGIIGIHSDTAGFYMGEKANKLQMKVAVAGFVLAYVDKIYLPGTPLTCTKDGWLTELKSGDFAKNPHKIVGTYWKNEPNEYWGPAGQEVLVKNRKWIKII